MAAGGPVLALIGVTAIWGWTFVVVRDAVSHYPVVPFLAMRFVLAAAILSPVALRTNGRRGGRPAEGRRDVGLRAGMAPGVVLSAAYLVQTLGLTYTTASKAGLLTGLFVVFTPLLIFVVAKTRPARATIAAVALAMAGTILLAGFGGGGAGSHEHLGDALEVATALALSLHIYLLSRIGTATSAAGVALSQMAMAAVLFSAVALVSGGFPVPSRTVWVAVLITGALASALAFLVQTYAQQRISPARTAIILACEPAFATFFGVVLAGDTFTTLQTGGAGLILGALLLHEAYGIRSRGV